MATKRHSHVEELKSVLIGFECGVIQTLQYSYQNGEKKLQDLTIEELLVNYNYLVHITSTNVQYNNIQCTML